MSSTAEKVWKYLQTAAEIPKVLSEKSAYTEAIWKICRR